LRAISLFIIGKLICDLSSLKCPIELSLCTMGELLARPKFM